jgi:cobalt-zinc-cadmium efflux system outer membrane protein
VLIFIVSALLVWPVGAGAQPSAPPSEAFLRLDQLERMALENNPTVTQVDAIVRAVLGRGIQARLYPNPLIGYSADDIALRSPGRSRHRFWVQQSIVTGNKRQLVQEATGHERLHAEAEQELQKRRVRSAVRALFYEALGAARLVEVRRDLARLVGEAVDVSEQLYNVGQADRPDVIEVEIEAERARLELGRAETDLERVWQALAAMVGHPVLPRATLVGDIEADVPTLDERALEAQILRDHPELAIARARVEHAKVSLARARADRLPNFFARGGAGYNFDRSETGRDVGTEVFFEIGVPLPLFNRNQGNIASAEAQLPLAEGELRRTELELRTRLAEVLKAYRDARRTVQAYRQGVLARAQRGYELYLNRFRQMAAAYPQVLIAQRTLVQVRAEYVRALVDLWQSVALLEGGLASGGLNAPAAVPGEPQVTIESVPFTVSP